MAHKPARFPESSYWPASAAYRQDSVDYRKRYYTGPASSAGFTVPQAIHHTLFSSTGMVLLDHEPIGTLPARRVVRFDQPVRLRHASRSSQLLYAQPIWCDANITAWLVRDVVGRDHRMPYDVVRPYWQVRLRVSDPRKEP